MEHPTIRKYLESKSKYGQGRIKTQGGGEGVVKTIIKESIIKESEGLSLGTRTVSVSLQPKFDIIKSPERGKSLTRKEVNIHTCRDQGIILPTDNVDGNKYTEST